MNFQNTKVFILPDPPEKDEEYRYTFTNKYDYVEKPNMNIVTELMECLFVEVIVQTRKHKRNIYWSA